MYNDIGEKIKSLAQVITAVGAGLSVIAGLCIIIGADSLIWLGVLTIVIGSLFSWLLSFVLYGYGEAIEKIIKIEKMQSIWFGVYKRMNEKDV